MSFKRNMLCTSVICSILIVASCSVPNKAAYTPKSNEQIELAIPDMVARFEAACVDQIRDISKLKSEVDALVRIGWKPVRFTPTYAAIEPWTDETVLYLSPSASGIKKNQCIVSAPSIPAVNLKNLVVATFDKRGISLEKAASTDPTKELWQWDVVNSSPATTVTLQTLNNDVGKRASISVDWP